MAVIESNNTITGTYGPFRFKGVPDSTTQVGALKGATLTNTLTGVQYTNTGTPAVPVWTVVGTQT